MITRRDHPGREFSLSGTVRRKPSSELGRGDCGACGGRDQGEQQPERFGDPQAAQADPNAQPQADNQQDDAAQSAPPPVPGDMQQQPPMQGQGQGQGQDPGQQQAQMNPPPPPRRTRTNTRIRIRIQIVSTQSGSEPASAASAGLWPARPQYAPQPGYGQPGYGQQGPYGQQGQYAQGPPPGPQYAQPTGPVTVPQGTMVQLRTSEGLDAKHAKDGQPVQFTVIRDVAVAAFWPCPRARPCMAW